VKIAKNSTDRETLVRRYRTAVLKDLRQQIKWITEAIVMDDQEWLDTYANQLSATALNLHSETMNNRLSNKESN
jgi:hypothetical protein